MTELIYMKNPNLFETTGHIIGHGDDSKGMYLVLNQSPFYPQGGGQPADQGAIIATNATYKVHDVRNINKEVRHYIIGDNHTIHPGEHVRMKVDEKRRTINSKYHTAGHLIAAVVEKTSFELKAIKGHQFPGEAYVEFDGTISNPEDFLHTVATAVKDSISLSPSVKTKELSSSDLTAITENLPYSLPEDKTLRVCHIEGFDPVPCGGTHVVTLKDISNLEIKKCKSKKGKTKISYEIS